MKPIGLNRLYTVYIQFGGGDHAENAASIIIDSDALDTKN